MAWVATACALLLIISTLIHHEALRRLSLVLPVLPVPSRAKALLLIMGAFAAHAVEIALYALTMYVLVQWLGVGGFGSARVPDFSMFLYFSAETYTSLGYGDIVPQGSLRLLAGTEALTGLLLIGWSASHAFAAIERSGR